MYLSATNFLCISLWFTSLWLTSEQSLICFLNSSYFIEFHINGVSFFPPNSFSYFENKIHCCVLSIARPFLLLCNIPLHMAPCLRLMHTWIAFNFCLLQIKLLWISGYKSLCGHMHSFLLNKCLGVEKAKSQSRCIF